MGDTDGHATYVHLYLNGLYWGLYNPVEKTDDGFAEIHYGGDKTEYDVITVENGVAVDPERGHSPNQEIDLRAACSDRRCTGVAEAQKAARASERLEREAPGF